MSPFALQSTSGHYSQGEQSSRVQAHCCALQVNSTGYPKKWAIRRSDNLMSFLKAARTTNPHRHLYLPSPWERLVKDSIPDWVNSQDDDLSPAAPSGKGAKFSVYRFPRNGPDIWWLLVEAQFGRNDDTAHLWRGPCRAG